MREGNAGDTAEDPFQSHRGGASGRARHGVLGSRAHRRRPLYLRIGPVLALRALSVALRALPMLASPRTGLRIDARSSAAAAPNRRVLRRRFPNRPPPILVPFWTPFGGWFSHPAHSQCWQRRANSALQAGTIALHFKELSLRHSCVPYPFVVLLVSLSGYDHASNQALLSNIFTIPRGVLVRRATFEHGLKFSWSR